MVESIESLPKKDFKEKMLNKVSLAPMVRMVIIFLSFVL
jgi:hypothetical protein